MLIAVASAAPIKIVNEEELRGHAKRGTAWPNNHHLRLQKEARQLGRDNATTGRAIYKAFKGDETIFMLTFGWASRCLSTLPFDWKK